MKEFKINVTKSSLNVIKEFRNYQWKKNKDGEFEEIPIDNWNHAMDAIRYGVTHVRRKPNFGSYAVS
jgi:phage terminase large subunit